MKYHYFCGACGHKFVSDTPAFDENGLHNNISCPECGAWDIYADTPEGAAESVRDQLSYEAAVEEWSEQE